MSENGEKKMFRYATQILWGIVGGLIMMVITLVVFVYQTSQAAQDSEIDQIQEKVGSIENRLNNIGKNVVIICSTVAKNQCEPYKGL